MDKLVPGLILAGISGVTVVAYQHHEAYIYFFIGIQSAVSLILFSVQIWETGLTHAYTKLMPFIKSDSYMKAADALEATKVLNGWYFIGYFALTLYLWMLFYLPQILAK